jgi:hypothetical protein
MASSSTESKSWPDQAPIRIRDGGFVAGLLQGVEIMEDELVIVIDGVSVLLPGDMEGRIRGLVGEEVVVARVDGQWRAAILGAGRRRCES